MKVLSVIFLVVLTIALSAATSVYVIELRSKRVENNHYQLVFGKVPHTTSELADEPSIGTSKPTEELVCFKLDTATGKTWRYVSDYYNDPNYILTTKGFEEVKEGLAIYNFAQKKRPKTTGSVGKKKVPSPEEIVGAETTTALKGFVTGIFYNPPSSSVLIDSTIFYEGDETEGIKVVKIHKDKVEFEKNGQQWSQKIQQTPASYWQ